jgi:F0F1-type ATP synthase delta subunit
MESGVLSVTVTSAYPIAETQRGLVATSAAEFLGKPGSEVAIVFQEDKALIGGIRMETTDTRYDGTIARTIKELRKSL